MLIRSVWLLLSALFLAAPASAQERVAFANLEVIIALMPEAKQVSEQLDTYQKELAKGLETKQAYAQQKLIEAQEAAASGIASDDKLAEYEAELKSLDREIRISAADADKKMLSRRKELMDPIVEKLQATIKEVAEAEGYAFVLNSLDGSGTSVVLYGREQDDLTERILSHMGISLPKEKSQG